MARSPGAVCLALALWQASQSAETLQPKPGTTPAIARFIEATSPDEKIARAALDEIAGSWKDSYAAMFIDLVRLMRAPRRPGPEPTEPAPAFDDDRSATSVGRRSDELLNVPDPGSPIRRRLLAFLARRTGRRFDDDLNAWREWIWTLPEDPHPDYAVLKGTVYGQIDPRMRAFFPAGVRSTIRLDEIDWGGVVVNGIPPLRYPAFVSAPDAGYLKDGHVVFGIVVNGQAKAYPKRILAWHEMAIDRIGGVEMTIVYCTLCGTVIPFESTAGGRAFRFGTSGLLYRSNKLMFDEQTSSLWSTFEGVPVVGPLVGSELTLTTHPVVTTTWKEWRTDHADTSVLSIETGYTRDYSEGAAYRDYFATDRLMFRVSKTDGRLPNKAEVVVLRLRGAESPARLEPVAIDIQLLRKHPVYSFTAASRRFVVVTSERGANRVFEGGAGFPEQRADRTIRDVDGRSWNVTEAGLVLEADRSRQLARVSAQRAFWFGWHAQFPETRLLK